MLLFWGEWALDGVEVASFEQIADLKLIVKDVEFHISLIGV